MDYNGNWWRMVEQFQRSVLCNHSCVIIRQEWHAALKPSRCLLRVRLRCRMRSYRPWALLLLFCLPLSPTLASKGAEPVQVWLCVQKCIKINSKEQHYDYRSSVGISIPTWPWHDDTQVLFCVERISAIRRGSCFHECFCVFIFPLQLRLRYMHLVIPAGR